ncbi:hypothetical protein PILCRDRAFT_145 [Piloderma croceum F 1598]|uniref:Uncharacterized protein n=1 Tax=Piloderma croceum (strain F 1598) TaxID=765440 RepID=A0A0C3BZM7_PILCF|nr:hypothetical protein PILCRDRAFT_145 [Piloderma croceum F 1598]
MPKRRADRVVIAAQAQRFCTSLENGRAFANGLEISSTSPAQKPPASAGLIFNSVVSPSIRGIFLSIFASTFPNVLIIFKFSNTPNIVDGEITVICWRIRRFRGIFYLALGLSSTFPQFSSHSAPFIACLRIWFLNIWFGVTHAEVVAVAALESPCTCSQFALCDLLRST